MKNTKKYIALGICAVTLASCADLDTEYYGGYVTPAQKENAVNTRPTLAGAAISGIFSTYKSTSFDSSGAHSDFGYASDMIGFDSMTADFIGKNSGYNWFTPWEAYSSPTESGRPTGNLWYNLYPVILAANTAIGGIPADVTADESRFYRAQALANRGYNYWVLANMYQFTYVGSEAFKCVPLITDENMGSAASDGCPRATVQEVFDQIISDYTAAIDYLTGNAYTIEKAVASKPKQMLSLATVYGLRARAYLTMGKYAEAAQDATNAIANFSGSPLSIAEANRPGFYSLDDHSWMWGIPLNPTDRMVTSGICNFPSMVSTFFSGGYTQVGAWRWAAKDMYDAIPATDVRKGWWLDENYKSAMLTPAEQEYIDQYVVAEITYGPDNQSNIMPYTNVKFSGADGQAGSTSALIDIPLMRIEEMYYIKAEGLAMSGNVSGGVQTLTDFVSQYRDPSFKMPASATAADVQEACFQQRRIEFWGEGLNYFEYQRLKKPIDRRNALFPNSFVYNIQANDPVRIYCIPTEEITANKQISPNDNNPNGSRPTPIV